jgi:hypothetical protein
MAKIGTIYRIEFKEDPDIRYIGSTVNELKYRWKQHKNDFSKYKKGKGNLASIYPYFEKYGIENFGITAIKRYAVCDKKHLRVYEQLWMNKLKCVNHYSAFSPKFLYNKKYREENKEERAEYNKKYREANKEELVEYIKKYREENIEKIREYDRQRYPARKEERAEYSKKYREANKEELAEKQKKYGSEKIECSICQCLIRRDSLARHNKTKKHQDNLVKLEEEKSKE